jgi:hypothetical protein
MIRYAIRDKVTKEYYKAPLLGGGILTTSTPEDATLIEREQDAMDLLSFFGERYEVVSVFIFHPSSPVISRENNYKT